LIFNRLWKKVTPKGSGALVLTYYYLRDAQGNEMCRYVKYTNTTSQLMYVAQEHSIYGSSRVGVDNRKDTLYIAGSYSPSWGGVGTSRRALGLKSFELANHLGNVLVTVSDKPVYKVSSGTIYFQPEVSSISDYYPFGAPIQGRGYASEGYRFGYNTQEKDDEISGPGNHNTATFWEYDGRLGRRWNLDPKFIIGVSPYAINGDNPIFYTDPNGDFRTKFGAQVYKFFHGGSGKVSKANSGIHKGEWSVSQKVHRDGGAEESETENRIGEVLIVQQVKWEWGRPHQGFEGFNQNNVDFFGAIGGGLTTLWGAAAHHSDVPKVAKNIGIIGTVVSAGTYINAISTGQAKPAHHLDAAISGTLLTLTVFPVTAPFAITAGFIYGGVRLVGGEAIDQRFNNLFTPSKALSPN
jgi:hypothetical protein